MEDTWQLKWWKECKKNERKQRNTHKIALFKVCVQYDGQIFTRKGNFDMQIFSFYEFFMLHTDFAECNFVCISLFSFVLFALFSPFQLSCDLYTPPRRNLSFVPEKFMFLYLFIYFYCDVSLHIKSIQITLWNAICYRAMRGVYLTAFIYLFIYFFQFELFLSHTKSWLRIRWSICTIPIQLSVVRTGLLEPAICSCMQEFALFNLNLAFFNLFCNKQ